MERERKSPSNLLARECIVEAMIKLIYEKPLSAITISELTEKAGVSRMTFYRNYGSKEDVWKDELADILERYAGESMAQHPGGIYYDREHMLHCFSYFYTYREFLDGLFTCGFGDIFLKYMTVYMLKAWSGYDRYKLQAFAGVLYALYISWSQGGYRESAEQMADLVGKLCQWD
jgi:AcrR family transcriptional regulator